MTCRRCIRHGKNWCDLCDLLTAMAFWGNGRLKNDGEMMGIWKMENGVVIIPEIISSGYWHEVAMRYKMNRHLHAILWAI